MHDLDLLKSGSRLKNIGNRSAEFVFDELHSKIQKEFIRMEPWEIEYLYNEAKKSRLGIQEIGRFRGGSTMVLAFANTDVKIHSIDIAPVDDLFLETLLQELQVGSNLNLIVDDSSTFKVNYNYDLLFIDGDHTYDGCYKDLCNWYDNLVIGGSVILHDSHHDDIRNAIADFTKNKDVKFILEANPNEKDALNAKYGSLCHFEKLG